MKENVQDWLKTKHVQAHLGNQTTGKWYSPVQVRYTLRNYKTFSDV